MNAFLNSGVSRPIPDPERSAALRREVEGSLTIPTLVHDGLFYVYILTNHSNSVLYIGFTCALRERVQQHREQSIEGFTKRYQVGKLIYYEEYADQEQAEKREKQIKGWRREKKTALIEKTNPRWEDLFEGVVGTTSPPAGVEIGRGIVRDPSTPLRSAQDLV